MGSAVPAEPLRKLQLAVKRSRRSSSVRFPIGFVRQEVSGESPPLAQLLRGGEVRLKLYLTLAMIATRAPHELDPPPASHLAAMLNLDDPTHNGARRINDALQWLHAKGFLIRTPRPGRTPHLQLLHPGSVPIGSGRYVSLPIAIWEEGWLYVLSARALALYLVLREATGGRGAATLPGGRKAQYDLSADTWTRATRELETAGLLDVREVFDEPSFETFELSRRRLEYTLTTDDFLASGPNPAR